MLDTFYRNILFSLSIYLVLFTAVFNNDVIDDFIEKEVQEGFPDAALTVTRYGKIVKQNIYGYKLRYDENGIAIKQPQLLTKR